METKIGNILEYFNSNVRNNTDRLLLVHGCNSKGVMGSGIARQIKSQYPRAFFDYADYIKNNKTIDILGRLVITNINDNSFIASGITQLDYGRDDKIRYVEYDALREVFLRVVSFNRIFGGTIIFPKIGAGLGNGDWAVISKIIEETIPTDMRSILFIMP